MNVKGKCLNFAVNISYLSVVIETTLIFANIKYNYPFFIIVQFTQKKKKIEILYKFVGILTYVL